MRVAASSSWMYPSDKIVDIDIGLAHVEERADVLGCDDVAFSEGRPFVVAWNNAGDIVAQHHADGIMDGHAFHGEFSLTM